jgi:RNA polymerase sigma-70 factor (ECF subfamily)
MARDWTKSAGVKARLSAHFWRGARTLPAAMVPPETLDAAMTRYAAGEDAAFDVLYRLMSGRLYAFCMRLTRRRSEADDLFQETFLKIHRSRATFVPRASAVHWAFAVARSVHLDRLRYRKRRPEAVAETEEGLSTFTSVTSNEGSPEEHARAKELMQVVDRVLRELPENQRAAYVLLREEGMSVAEAASVLGATPTAVKLRAFRAYEAIRAALRAAGITSSDSDEGPPA